ncbi:MAG: efflux transporter outer membrane subunit [Alphaproteobacteria bacterium]|nr:efflux transporter outer membrane subunit [Alphaproteobacteria bacterium]
MIPLLLLLMGPAARAAAPLPPDLPERLDAGAPGEVAATPWWESFGDPGLERVVTQTLASNGSLAAYDALVDQAKAGARQTASSLLPSASVNFSASSSPRAVRCAQIGAQLGSTPTGCDDEGWYVTGSGVLSASWALDIWGANTLSWRASRFSALATAGDRDAQALSLSTTVANAWYDVEATRAQIAIVEEQIAASQRVLELVELRYEAGSAAGPEVLQQRQQLAATRAQLPQSKATLRSLEGRLTALMGDVSGSVPAGEGALPALPPPPTAGTPADLVENRPDLRSAAADLDAAEARRKAATRAAMPALAVSASAGYQTFEYEDADSFVETASVGASLKVPIFQGGYALATVQSAKAAEDAALRTFEQAARTAVYEVEDAWQRELAQREVVALLDEQEALARRSFEDSLERYQAGLNTYVDVLVAQSSWQQAQISLLNGQRQLVTARIDLHDALGGAWVASLSSDGAR